jgi:hypothetical protein
MPWIDSLDWSSLNALRRYPIREGLSAKSTDGAFSIPDTLITDFTLCASSDISRRFFISQVFNKINSIIIQISDTLDNVVGSFTIDRAAHTQDTDYPINATNRYVGTNGKITIGSFDDLDNQPAGQFNFLLSATEFEPRTIIPGLKGIDRMLFIDAANGQYGLSGDVFLTARNNLNFSYAGDRVIMDAGDGLGLNKPCVLQNCIKKINGVGPDSRGNVSILGLDCVNINSPALYTLNIQDTCCTPCSGCDDLEQLTSRLTSLENKFLDLKGSYNSVNAQLSNYLSTVNSNCACPS